MYIASSLIDTWLNYCIVTGGQWLNQLHRLVRRLTKMKKCVELSSTRPTHLTTSLCVCTEQSKNTSYLQTDTRQCVVARDAMARSSSVTT
jgi:hypothetical protein